MMPTLAHTAKPAASCENGFRGALSVRKPSGEQVAARLGAGKQRTVFHFSFVECCGITMETIRIVS